MQRDGVETMALRAAPKRNEDKTGPADPLSSAPQRGRGRLKFGCCGEGRAGQAIKLETTNHAAVSTQLTTAIREMLSRTVLCLSLVLMAGDDNCCGFLL